MKDSFAAPDHYFAHESRLEHETLVRLIRSRDFLAHFLDQPISLREAAGEAYLSPYHYHRLFSRAFGKTPHHFLSERRIEEAKRLLRGSDLSVTEICFQVGYSSLGSFSSMFRRVVGYTPSDYRLTARRMFAISGLWLPQYVPSCFLVRNGIARIEKPSVLTA